MLTIGQKTFTNNLIQGPLAGVSCAPFRYLIWKYSQPAFIYTEMISCKTILYQPKLATRFLTVDPEEGPVCFQLSSQNPHELGEAVKRATELGATLIDLNCGCPVKKIRSKGAGSRLLADAGLLYQLITAMKQNTHLPIGIKIRVDSQSGEQFNASVAKAVSDAGTDFLVVHGRHWSEHYETPAHHNEIEYFAQSVSIPVIGNGDVNSLASLHTMLTTGVKGAMISRATIGRPWLLGEWQANLKQQPFTQPTLKEIGELFFIHVTRLSVLLNNEKFALIQARKFAKYYARPLSATETAAFLQAMNQCETLLHLEKIYQQYFKNSLENNDESR